MLSMCLLFSMLLPGLVSANANGTGVVNLIGGSQTTVYFSLDPVPVGRVSCNSNSGYQYAIDTSTDSGKSLYTALLTAVSSGRQLRVVGTGQCTVHSEMEDVSYWIFYP